jgi:hypothetical protein
MRTDRDSDEMLVRAFLAIVARSEQNASDQIQRLAAIEAKIGRLAESVTKLATALTAVKSDRTVTETVTTGPYLLFSDALRYAGFGKHKAYDLIREGKLVARKMGRRTVIERRSIDSYLASLPLKFA